MKFIHKQRFFYPALIFAGLVLLGLSFQTLGYANAWKLWKVPTGDVVFLDFHLITGGAESYAAGSDPVTDNFKDVHPGRIFNYPRLWYLLLAGKVTNADAIPLGLGMLALFFLAVSLFPGKIDRSTALLLTLATFSPAVLLGVERANVDLLFFALLAFALLAMEANLWLGVGLIFISAVFKLFPIIGVTVFLDQTPKSLRPILITGGLFLIYLLLTFKDLAGMFGGTAKGDFASYGVTVFANKIFNETGWPSTNLNPIFYLLAGVVFGVALWGGFRWKTSPEPETRLLRAFRMGAAIYIGTFFLGNNWDYRLTFLLFAIPQLWHWARQTHLIRQLAGLTLIGILLMLWHFFFYYPVIALRPVALAIYLLDEAFNWAVFGLLTYLFAASLPEWLTQPVRQSFHTLHRAFKG